MLATAITPTWAQQIKGVVIDQKSKETLIGTVITAHSLAHEDAIRQVENGRGNESHQRWDKQFDKQSRHVHCAKIQSTKILQHLLTVTDVASLQLSLFLR